MRRTAKKGLKYMYKLTKRSNVKHTARRENQHTMENMHCCQPDGKHVILYSRKYLLSLVAFKPDDDDLCSMSLINQVRAKTLRTQACFSDNQREGSAKDCTIQVVYSRQSKQDIDHSWSPLAQVGLHRSFRGGIRRYILQANSLEACASIRRISPPKLEYRSTVRTYDGKM